MFPIFKLSDKKKLLACEGSHSVRCYCFSNYQLKELYTDEITHNFSIYEHYLLLVAQTTDDETM